MATEYTVTIGEVLVAVDKKADSKLDILPEGTSGNVVISTTTGVERSPIILDGIIGITDEVNSESTNNEIPTAKAVWNALVASEIRLKKYLVGGGEQFRFTIDTRQTNVDTNGTDKTFSIPTSRAYSYDWVIGWDDGTSQHVSGTGEANSEGIPHEYAVAGEYQIIIMPAGDENEWLRAFGFNNNTNGANATANKQKMVSPDSPLTVAMCAAPGATTVGNSVFQSMFYGCDGIGFTMGTNFGFVPEWNNVTTVGNNFCFSMFGTCKGSSFNMATGFNLPQGITSVGSQFCMLMFTDCIGDAFTMNGVFNIPPGITGVSSNGQFLDQTFARDSGNNLNNRFKVNGIFQFPQGLNSTNVSRNNNFRWLFAGRFTSSAQQQDQLRSAVDIVGILAEPNSDRNTFPSGMLGYNDVATNWQGT